MNIGEQLKRKIGPLPVWAWGAIGAAGILVIRQWQRNAAPAATEDLTADAGVPMTGGGYGTGVTLPASAPPPDQPAFGENLYLSFPYGEGYVSVEGPGSQILDVLGLIPFAPVAPYPQQALPPGGGTVVGIPPPQPAAVSPVAIAPTFATVEAAKLGPVPGFGLGEWIPGYGQAVPAAPGFISYVSPAVAGAPAQVLSKPAENFLATQNMNCQRIRANPEWYTAAQRAACGV